MTSFSRLAVPSLCVLALCSSPVFADSRSPSTPSDISAISVVKAPLALSEGVTTLSIQGIRASGNVVELSVKGAGQMSQFLIQVPANAVAGLSIGAGSVIEVTTDSVGHMLRYAGKAIAYVPTQAGKALIHHTPISK